MPDVELDEIARIIFDSRSRRATPVTDEEWESRKKRFAVTHACLLEDAQQMIDDGEFDE